MKPQKRTRGGKVRWVARYRGSDGVERSKTFELEREAKQWVAEREREVRNDEWIDPKAGEITVGDLWAKWEQAARTDGTKRVRSRVGKNLGRLGRTPLSAIRTSDVREWLHVLRSGRPWVKGCDGVADSTATTWFGQLSGCMELAVDDGLIRKSPCKGAGKNHRLAVRVVTNDELLSSEEVLTMAAAATTGVEAGQSSVPAHPTLGRMIIVGAATGLRAGEMAGLRIRSVDFLRREAYITEQGSARSSEFEWGPLKTVASRRTLPLPRTAVDALAEQLAEQPCSDRSMPIFRTARDTMWTSSTIAYAIRSLRERLDLAENVTWHSLRHFYASTLIYSGASVKTVQNRLGHSTAATTLEIYAHMWPGEDERTRSALDAVLDRDQTGTGAPEADPAG
ncbi:tyrosine-type recombinase/integrase [Rhodococcus jostii]|uniref:tyrosine-type recombinase/integrase n=1 Tax=Rhodococcus jostii TaxID=132919 RepID=UPI003647E1A9